MCHSYSLFPFYTPLSLPSFLSFSYVPALFFTFFTLCELLRNASRLQRIASGKVWFVSRVNVLGVLFCLRRFTRCVRVEFFFIFSVLFFFYFLSLSLSLSLLLFSISCYAFDRVWYALLISRDQRPFLSSRRVALYLVLRGLCTISSRSFSSDPSQYLSSEVRCASLWIVMPPHY